MRKWSSKSSRLVVVEEEPRAEESPSSPPSLWSDEPDWWLDRVSSPTPPPTRKEDGEMAEQAPPPPPLPAPAVSMPVDDASLRGRKMEEIATVRLGFSFCCERVADKTLNVDGERGTRRRRVRRTGAGWRAPVVGLRIKDQRRHRRCLF